MDIRQGERVFGIVHTELAEYKRQIGERQVLFFCLSVWWR